MKILFKKSNSIRHKSNITLLYILMVSSILAFLYWPVGSYDYTSFDDDIYVYKNSFVKKGLSKETFYWAFSLKDKNGTYWTPVIWLSLMIDVTLFGINPGMAHIINLFLHIFNTFLLFFIFKKMLDSIWIPAIIALLFAIHPLNVESVVWISERKNVLSSFFWLLTTYTYLFYIQKKNKTATYVCVLGIYLLGLMAKPMLITLPCTLLLLDFWPLKRMDSLLAIKKRVIEKIPFFICAGLVTFISSKSLSQTDSFIPFSQVPFALRLENAFVSYGKYILKFLWPKNLAIFYPYPDHVPITSWVFAVIFLSLFSALTIMTLKKKPWLIVGWFWFLGTLFPVMGFTQAGLWPEMADRWAYMPLIGLFLIGAMEIDSLTTRSKIKKPVIMLLSIFILFLGSCTYAQVRFWHNNITLYQHAVDMTQDNVKMLYNLANEQKWAGQWELAVANYQKALKIKPKDRASRHNLAQTLVLQGKLDEAINAFNSILINHPTDENAHLNLAKAINLKEGTQSAITYLQNVIKKYPHFAKAHNNIGVFMAELHRLDAAQIHFQKAIAIDPNFKEARSNLNKISQKQKR